jgi:hypothetical protein
VEGFTVVDSGTVVVGALVGKEVTEQIATLVELQTVALLLSQSSPAAHDNKLLKSITPEMHTKY